MRLIIKNNFTEFEYNSLGDKKTDKFNSYIKHFFLIELEKGALLEINDDAVFCSYETFNKNELLKEKENKTAQLIVSKKAIETSLKHEEGWIGEIRDNEEFGLTFRAFLEEDLFNSFHHQLSHSKLEEVSIDHEMHFSENKHAINKTKSELKFGADYSGRHLIWKIDESDNARRIGITSITFRFKSLII
jgi:hypothetical protein